MGIYQKSALLSFLRLRLEKDRDQDWQALQRRDREWFIAQPAAGRWSVLEQWLRSFSTKVPGGVGLLSLALGFLGFVAGFLLVAGLLEFKSFERINLLWFLLLGVVLPFLFWLIGLLLAMGEGGFPVLALLEKRAPAWMQNQTLYPLLRQTAVVFSQQVSLIFASGMLLAFLVYLLVTDLAFGWSSTIDIGATTMHALTSAVSWPWQAFWPDAVPSLELIAESRYYRAAPAVADAPANLGHWWRFVIMCLLVYVWLPRLLSYGWQRWRLGRMQSNCFDNDALIAGWWQRMQSGAVSQKAEAVQQLGRTQAVEQSVERLPVCPHVVLWGSWSEAQWSPVKETLNKRVPDFQLYKVKDKQWLAETTGGILRNPAETALIVCKGWEPPTGELADFCRAIVGGKAARFLWPVPLSSMPDERVTAFNQSWRAFVPSLPDNFNLYLGKPDE